MDKKLDRRKLALTAFISLLVLSTCAAGLYHKQYFVVFVFGVWICVEWFLQRFPWRRGAMGAINRVRFYGVRSLLRLFSKFDANARVQLKERLQRLHLENGLTDYERRWLERFRSLIELKTLCLGNRAKGIEALRQAFLYEATPKLDVVAKHEETGELTFPHVSEQDIVNSATTVAELYWKLYDCAIGKYPELTHHARKLYQRIFGVPFDGDEESSDLIEGVTDSMQRDHGLPFLILNLIRSGNWQWGRKIAQELLKEFEDIEMDETVRTSLYWASEVYWFTHRRSSLITDHDSSIRYIYHLCFTQAETTGFLEIDSRYFSQFGAVNELAREGFLYKEVLIDKIIQLWRNHEGYFDGVFQLVLESMTQQKNKIYDDRESWERFWHREWETFSRDYLYLVEGNLCYASDHFADAAHYYELALEENPELVPALYNQLFAYAKLNDVEGHSEWVEKLLEHKALFPFVLYVIGDSYLLLDQEDEARKYYERLKGYAGWEKKTNYYISTFCFENGLFDRALSYAEKAHEINPHDSSIRYHLSLCYDAVGEKRRALDTVRALGEAPEWVNYYRFTLERDAGEEHDASQTLMQIPTDYFQDPEELEEAVEFAKRRKDLVLLRHLKRKA